MNPNIYEAALDLGATPMQALRKVIIPEIRPGMISGFMLALTLSIDDFAELYLPSVIKGGNAFHLYLCRCPQRRADSGTASAFDHYFRGGAGLADCH